MKEVEALLGHWTWCFYTVCLWSKSCHLVWTIFYMYIIWSFQATDVSLSKILALATTPWGSGAQNWRRKDSGTTSCSSFTVLASWRTAVSACLLMAIIWRHRRLVLDLSPNVVDEGLDMLYVWGFSEETWMWVKSMCSFCVSGFKVCSRKHNQSSATSYLLSNTENRQQILFQH